MFESMNNGEYNCAVRIFMGLSCTLWSFSNYITQQKFFIPGVQYVTLISMYGIQYILHHVHFKCTKGAIATLLHTTHKSVSHTSLCPAAA